MTTSLTHQTLTPARHKIDPTRSREKLLPTGHKKPVVSRRPALFFIRGIAAPSNAPFFPSTSPYFRLLFAAPIVVPSTPMNTEPPCIPSREDGIQNWGRGACDTRGNIALMLKPAARLHCAGKCNFGPLFVCEERNIAAVVSAITPRRRPWEEAMDKPKPQDTLKTLRPSFPFAGVTKVEAITEK